MPRRVNASAVDGFLLAPQRGSGDLKPRGIKVSIDILAREAAQLDDLGVESVTSVNGISDNRFGHLASRGRRNCTISPLDHLVSRGRRDCAGLPANATEPHRMTSSPKLSVHFSSLLKVDLNTARVNARMTRYRTVACNE